MNILYKKDGTKVEVNDSSLEYALSLGWTKAEPKKATKKPVKKES
jgi:hypothetical protein